MGRAIAASAKIIMKIKISHVKFFLLLLLLFIFPWQTRLIYQTAYIGNNFWEYDSLSLYGTEILLGMTILLFLIDKLHGGFREQFIKYFNKKRLAKILIIFLGILSLYLLASTNHAIAWQYLNWVVYGICLIFIILESQLSFKKLSLYVWGGGLVQAILSIWQFFNQYIPANKWLGMAVQDPHQLGVAVVEFGSERWLRAYGAFGWPNSLGIYLAVIFVLGVILIRQEKDDKYKIWLLIGQTIVLFGLFFSLARGSWLAAVVGLFVLGFKKYKEKIFWQQIGVYIFTFLILLIIFKPLVFSRLDWNNRLEKMSLSQRISQWSEFQQVFAKNYLVGVGPGNYTIVLHGIYPKHSVGNLKPVHNIFLLFIAEWGILGVFLLLFLFYNGKILNLSFAPLSVLLVAGLFDHWSVSTFTGLIFFCLVIGLSTKYIAIDTKVSPE